METKHLSKSFKSFYPVKGIDLKVKRGGVYGFLGPNGAGKTTTIRMLLGLIQPTQGTISIFGKDVRKHRLEILNKVGSMVESPSYYGHLSGYENLEIVRKLRGAAKRDIGHVLGIVRLQEWQHKKVKTYSLGMKQRLGIAQALLGNPELLILDEPTNGLDPAGIQEIRELITRLPVEQGITVLVSSHILKEIELMASEVGIIYKGELLFQGSLSELRSKGYSGIRVAAAPVEESAALLSRLGYTLKRDGDHLLIDAPSERISTINQDLVLAGFRVSHLSESKESLEDIFLNMTRGGESW